MEDEHRIREFGYVSSVEKGDGQLAQADVAATQADGGGSLIASYARARSLQFAEGRMVGGSDLATEPLAQTAGKSPRTNSANSTEHSKTQRVLEEVRDRFRVVSREKVPTRTDLRAGDVAKTGAYAPKSMVANTGVQDNIVADRNCEGRESHTGRPRDDGGLNPPNPGVPDLSNVARNDRLKSAAREATSTAQAQKQPTDDSEAGGAHTAITQSLRRSSSIIPEARGSRLPTAIVSTEIDQIKQRRYGSSRRAIYSNPKLELSHYLTPTNESESRSAREHLQTSFAPVFSSHFGPSPSRLQSDQERLTWVPSAHRVSESDGLGRIESQDSEHEALVREVANSFGEQEQTYRLDAIAERILKITDQIAAIQDRRPVTIKAPSPRMRMSGGNE